MNKLKSSRLGLAWVSAAVWVLGFAPPVRAQRQEDNTQINLPQQGKNADFSNYPFTKPAKTGSSLPATCSVGEMFFETGAPAGQNLFGCTSANTWSLFGGSGG